MTPEQALLDFLNTFDPTPDGSLTRDDFVDYYANISAAIDSDDYFELMVRNAWHMSGGQVRCLNFEIQKPRNSRFRRFLTACQSLGWPNCVSNSQVSFDSGVLNLRDVMCLGSCGGWDRAGVRTRRTCACSSPTTITPRRSVFHSLLSHVTPVCSTLVLLMSTHRE